MSKVMGRQVATVEERLFCKCGEEMKWTGACLTVNPPLYPHICITCRYTENVSGFSYPREVSVPLGEWQKVENEG